RAPLAGAAGQGRKAFAAAVGAAAAAKPELLGLAPVVLYRTLGPTLPDGAAPAAVLWGIAQQCALQHPAAVRRAGIDAPDAALGDALFDAILASPSGLVFSVDTHDDAWRRVGADGDKLDLAIPDLLDDLHRLRDGPPPAADPASPFVLPAGERGSFTANTIYRDPAWRKKDLAGSLRVNPDDAARLGLADGGAARVTTRRGSV